jgi:hypothetical protein
MGDETELRSKTELLPGTLDLLLLKTVSLEPMHGYGIAQRLRQISQDVLQIEEGSLYPALQRRRSEAANNGGSLDLKALCKMCATVHGSCEGMPASLFWRC